MALTVPVVHLVLPYAVHRADWQTHQDRCAQCAHVGYTPGMDTPCPVGYAVVVRMCAAVDAMRASAPLN